MKHSYLFLLSLFIFSCQVNAQDGFIKIKSSNSVAVTTDKLSNILTQKGMSIFATIDHQKGAEAAGLELRPTTLVIFGNPKVGTKLMQCDQKIGYTLPLKLLIWQDEKGVTWIGYREPSTLTERYNLEECSGVLEKVKNAMANFAKAAAS